MSPTYRSSRSFIFRWSLAKKGKHVCNLCHTFVCAVIALGVTSASFISPAQANPADGTVTSGAASFSTSGNTLTINQTSDRAIIEWGSFDIGAGETTQFIQPGSKAWALNRVVNSNQISTINGNLLANGHVLVINPNGVLIGPGGNIDVAGFIASSADIDNNTFMNSTGALHFNHAGNNNARIENQGHITIKDSGLGLLVAPNVRNSGIIEGNLARIQLAAADTYAVDMYGDGLLSLALSNNTAPRTIQAENTGSIIAPAGKVMMTAATASDVVNSVINTSGIIEARSLSSKGGEIVLTGAGAHVQVSGQVDASGKTGGGTIKIGSQTTSPLVSAKAKQVDITAQAQIKADALDIGDGGLIEVWSDTLTNAFGSFFAQGGAMGGNGGRIETSSDGSVDITGAYGNTSAGFGSYGEWLLDPATITVDNALASTINSAVSNFILSATSSITFSANINMTNAGVGLSATSGTGGINMANQYIRTNGGSVTWNTTGALSMNNSTLYTRGGNVSLTGNTVSINNNSGVSTQGGSVTIASTSTGTGNTVSINSSKIDTTSALSPSIGGIHLIQNGSILALGSLGNPQNVFVQNLNGGAINISGKKLSGNSVCFAAGGAGCASSDPIPSIALTITADPKTKLYGALDPLLTYSVSGSLMSGDYFTGGLTRATGQNVGSYAINQGTLSVFSTAYTYTITYVGNFLIITPATLTITALDQGKTYGQNYNLGTSSFSVSGLQYSDVVNAVNLSSSGAAGTANVGNYAINASNATGTGLGNYSINYIPGNLHVSPALLTITANNQNKNYGTNFSFAGNEFTVGGTLYNGNTVTGATLASAGAAGTATIGNYTITASNAVGTGLGNYTISYANGNFHVDPAFLTLTANNQNKTYGSSFAFLGNEFTVGGTLYNGDTVTGAALASTGTTAAAPTGDYTISVSNATGTGLGNYSISYAPGNLHISPALLTITANNQSKTYGSSFAFSGNEFTTSGTLYNGDNVTGATLASTAAAATTGVGSYAITASNAIGSGLGNYTISYVNGNFNISPATLTVTMNDQTNTYGSTYSFNGTEYTLGGTLYNGDQLLNVYGTSAGAAGTANVGSYTISPTIAVASNGAGVTGNFFSNYTINFADGTFHVDPALLTITAHNQTKTYGSSFIFSGNEFSVGGTLYNGDTVTSTTLASAGAAGTATVGNYAISTSNAVGTGLGNYIISYADGTFAVNPAWLTITANNQSKNYGSTFAFSGNEFTVGGTLYNGDTVTSATFASAGAAGTANIGDYTINTSNATGTGLGNYSISYAPGTLHISPALLTITANDQKKAYGTSFIFLGNEFTTTGTLFNGDNITSVGLDSAGAASSVAAGDYIIDAFKASGSGLGNYLITYAKGTMTVTQPQILAPLFEISALGRPIVSVANKTIVLDRPFETIETLTRNTDVSIKLPSASGTFAAGNLADITPAAGGDSPEDLQDIAPAAGGPAPSSGGDIGCANNFLDNRPCQQEL